MGKTERRALGVFGDRLQKLLDETRYGSPNKLAEEIGMVPSTLYRWMGSKDPRVRPSFYSDAAEAVGLTEAEVLRRLTGKEGESTMVMERSERYEPRGELHEIQQRWAQPMSDRTIAVQALGRLEQYAARIQALGDEYRVRVDELARMALEEITLARRALMKNIDHDDKGKKV